MFYKIILTVKYYFFPIELILVDAFVRTEKLTKYRTYENVQNKLFKIFRTINYRTNFKQRWLIRFDYINFFLIF